MTQHRSLRSGGEEAKFRSVLKRYERIMELAGKDRWSEEKDSVYHLPKVKRIKFKAKKKAAAEEVAAEGAVPAEGAAQPVPGGTAPAGKGAPAGGKGAPAAGKGAPAGGKGAPAGGKGAPGK
jgi:small basic protein (TIGR04137 family)